MGLWYHIKRKVQRKRVKSLLSSFQYSLPKQDGQGSIDDIFHHYEVVLGDNDKVPSIYEKENFSTDSNEYEEIRNNYDNVMIMDKKAPKARRAVKTIKKYLLRCVCCRRKTKSYSEQKIGMSYYGGDNEFCNELMPLSASDLKIHPVSFSDKGNRECQEDLYKETCDYSFEVDVQVHKSDKPLALGAPNDGDLKLKYDINQGADSDASSNEADEAIDAEISNEQTTVIPLPYHPNIAATDENKENIMPDNQPPPNEENENLQEEEEEGDQENKEEIDEDQLDLAEDLFTGLPESDEILNMCPPEITAVGESILKEIRYDLHLLLI